MVVNLINANQIIVNQINVFNKTDQPIEREQRPLETKRRIKRCPAKNEKKRQGSEHFIEGKVTHIYQYF